MMAVKAACVEVDGHAVEGADLVVALAVDLRPRRRRRGGQRGRSPRWAWSDRKSGSFILGWTWVHHRSPGSVSARAGRTGAVSCRTLPGGCPSVLRARRPIRMGPVSARRAAMIWAAAAEERRVVTVLFADLVGFTGLSERHGPREGQEARRRLLPAPRRPTSTSFGGRVDKILGDAILALFGAPVAHEDDAERAVRAALRMQRSIAERVADLELPIQMRIGVNTGEVLVGALRAGGDYTAMGDVVNIASRLQTAAPPGGCWSVPPPTPPPSGAIALRAHRRGRGPRARGDGEAWMAIEPITLPGRRRRRVPVPFVGRDAGALALGRHRAHRRTASAEPCWP